jgi:hypothetical protein
LKNLGIFIALILVSQLVWSKEFNFSRKRSEQSIKCTNLIFGELNLRKESRNGLLSCRYSEQKNPHEPLVFLINSEKKMIFNFHSIECVDLKDIRVKSGPSDYKWVDV